MIFDLTTISKFKNAYPKMKKDVFEKMPIFAFIHADWCGHCRNVLPEWEKFIKKMKSSNSKNFKVAILDIKDDVFNHILQNHSSDFLGQVLSKSVMGYPTIFYMEQKNENGFHESTIFSYSGNRTAEGFMDFIKEHETNSSTSKKEKKKDTSTKPKKEKKKDTSTKPKKEEKEKKEKKEKSVNKEKKTSSQTKKKL